MMKSNKQSGVRFYLNMFLYTLAACLLRIIALLPLACAISYKPADIRFWACLITPLCYVLLVWPLRFSFAEALVQPDGEHSFSIVKGFNLSDYSRKFVLSLQHAVYVLLWAIPFAALMAYYYHCYKNVDAITLMQGVNALGTGLAKSVCAVRNFFGGIFGAQPAMPSTNSFMEGIIALGIALGITLLIVAYGSVRASAARYIWAQAKLKNEKPSGLIRSQLRGRRWQQFGVAFVNLLLLVPFIAVVLVKVKGVVSSFSTQLMMVLAGGKLSLPDMSALVLPLVLAFVFLFLTVLPIRRFRTADFAVKAAARK